jgi:predicted nucleic acid-binding protein
VDEAYVLDSYALLAHFENEAGGEKVTSLLRAAEAGQTKLFLCVINLGEIYYNTVRERGREKAEEVKFITGQLPIALVNADLDLSIEAATLKAAHPLAYSDCFAAALAVRQSAKVVTGDPEFAKFGTAVEVEWIAAKPSSGARSRGSSS